jgi:hypothetical protein
MIILIEGLNGSGKTYLMAHMLEWEYKKYKAELYVNFPLKFGSEDRVIEWSALEELQHLTAKREEKYRIIGIDESQKLLDCHRWASLNPAFREMLAQHRKFSLDVYTTTQSISHVDKRLRDLVGELYHCESVFRWPADQRQKPVLQWVNVYKMERRQTEDNRSVWRRKKRQIVLISKFWSKELYNTYGTIGLSHYLLKVCRKKSKLFGKLYSRNLVNSGKARL